MLVCIIEFGTLPGMEERNKALVTELLVHARKLDGLLESWSDWLTFFGAGLPAWGAACHAIAVEGEFGRMAERSEAMVRELERAGQRLENRGQGLHGDALGAETFTTARLLLEEVTDWHIVHQRPDFQP